MTVADTNVRLARGGPAATARGARRFALARLLLLLSRRAQLDRRLLLLLAASPMFACIVPVRPEFQDPPGVINSAPEIIAADPAEGLIVTTRTFTITARDHDGDRLYFRLIADYPEPPGSVIPLHRVLFDEPAQLETPGQPVVVSFDKTIDCFIDALDTSLASHRIMGVLADREFVPDSRDLTAVADGGRTRPIVWFWNVSCAPPTPPLLPATP
jgi:hypothetical protein